MNVFNRLLIFRSLSVLAHGFVHIASLRNLMCVGVASRRKSSVYLKFKTFGASGVALYPAYNLQYLSCRVHICEKDHRVKLAYFHPHW